MKVNGRKTRCMDMDLYSGKMERNMRDSLLMIKEKVKVNSFGKMDVPMMECGEMGSNMGEVSLQQRMDLSVWESGRMVVKSSGFHETNEI